MLCKGNRLFFDMPVDVLLGLQWGDEGKGKIVDVLTPNYKVIARFQGGPNAGHTLEFEGIKHVLHTIPSGIFRPDTQNVVGNGVVIDPVILKKEIDALKALNVDVSSKLVISRKAALILPTHRLLDAASEAAKGEGKIGSTLKGIGPTYMDKTGRNGLRVGDTEDERFAEKFERLTNKHLDMLERMHPKRTIEDRDIPVLLEPAEPSVLREYREGGNAPRLNYERYIQRPVDARERYIEKAVSPGINN